VLLVSLRNRFLMIGEWVARHRQERLMKARSVRWLFSFVTALAVLACVRAVPAGADPQVTLVRDGRPNGVIVWWSSTESPTPEFAASELSAYLARMSGARMRVVHGSLDDPGSADGVASGIVIATGDSAEPFERRTSVPHAWTRPGALRLSGSHGDAYAITTIGDDRLVLDGADHRGTLYAAYDLLERFGARFFAPRFDFYEGDAEYVPHRRTVATAALDVTQRPGMAYRKAYVEEGWSHTPTTLRELIDWMAKNRKNVLAYPYDYQAQGLVRWDQWRERIIPELDRRGISLEVGGHGYQSFLPRDEYP
jgi:hypothetical protein